MFYGEDALDRSTVNRELIKYRSPEPGRTIILDKTRVVRPIAARDNKYAKLA